MALRAALRHQLQTLVGAEGEGRSYNLREDDGLFGPSSVSWRVHGDFTSMMIGGVGALFMQMLHPAALAGVWDHSDFRQDMHGRLRRTAQFIAATTYGSNSQAQAAVDRVRHIHDRVHGRLPDGTSYSANDPDLLTWIHVAELHNFLRAYLLYRDPSLSPAEQDRYFAENAVIAERLGARGVPVRRAEAEDYLRNMRASLRFDARTLKVSSALINHPAPNAALLPFSIITTRAGLELLPDWAQQMHGLHFTNAERRLIRRSVARIATVTRWALR